MQTKRLWRSLVSYGTALLLAVQVLSFITPASLVRASTPVLRITEINWAGSPGHVTDQWVELQNVSGAPIVFATTPYTLEATIGGTSQTLATLDAGDGILPTDFYLVLSRESAGSVNSSLLGASPSALYEQKATLQLPSIATAYHLMQGTTPEDSIDTGSAGIPFAGSAATPSHPATASMSRITPTAPGNEQSSWYTAKTMGVNFATNAAEQYGTPGESNVEVTAPSNLTITPPSSVNEANPPTVNGTVGASASTVTVTYDRVSFSPAPYSRSYSAAPVSNNFSITATTPALNAGRYLVFAQAQDTAGNKSISVPIVVAPGTMEYNYLVAPFTTPVGMPTLNTYPSITNANHVVISGNLAPFPTLGHEYKAVEVLRNGLYYTTIGLSAGDTQFSADLLLKANMVNTLSFFAVDELGEFSHPAVATVTQDSIAPSAVVANLVVVTSNFAGTPDSLLGLGGAAEAYTTLFAYADSGLTQLIASVPVISSGGFGPIDLGDNLHATVWMVVKDAAGNVSPVTSVENPFGFIGGGATNFTMPKVVSIGNNQVKISWDAVAGASFYRLKYKVAGGTFTTPMVLCSGTATCSYQTTVINLKSGTSYVVAMAAVDQFGTQGPFSEVSFTTTGTAVVENAVATTPAKVTKTSTTRATDTVTKVDTTVAPTPTPSASPDQGQVKSATDDTNRNWTPWIILGVLVGIAILATAGYFYWFGGEEEEVVATSAPTRVSATKETPSKRSMPSDESDSSPPKRSSKDKRW